MKVMVVLPALLAFSQMASANCMSHSTEIPYREHVCFAHSMQQYACRKQSGEYGLVHVQRLSLKSSLKDKGMCYHVDSTNDRPARNNLMSSAENGIKVAQLKAAQADQELR